MNSLPELLKAKWKRNFELTAKMPHQVRVDVTPVRHELIAIVAIPYEKLGFQTLGFIEGLPPPSPKWPRIAATAVVGGPPPGQILVLELEF